MNYLFISGMGRSGTTLLEKILCSHPQLSVLSQPYPYLFSYAKQAFFDSINYPKVHYHMGTLFRETRYSNKDLASFLERYQVNKGDILSIFKQMEEYDGQYQKFPDIKSRIKDFKDGSLADSDKFLVHRLKHREKTVYCGSKETHCEEFYPFFLSQGIKCINIIRDPRDVIASFNYGEGGKFGGRIRPTLFYARVWRKSVSFAIYLQSNANFLSIKYEDLTADPFKTLRTITRFMNIDPFGQGALKQGIFDQKGEPWLSNSSFKESGEITTASVGKFRQIMPGNLIQYIEATTFPEMIHLGYSLQFPISGCASALGSFTEPFPIARPEFESHYSSSAANINQELERIKMLQSNGTGGSTIPACFIFMDTYRELAKTLLRVR